MRRQPRPQLRRVAREERQALGVPRPPRCRGAVRWLGRPRRGDVGRLMPHEHPRRGRFQLLRLALEVGALPAAALRRVAWQLDPIDRDHLPAEESLLITDREHRGENVGDVRAERADEGRDRREVRRARAAQGNEGHVVLAQPGDRPAADDPARVGAEDDLENDLEQHRRGIRGGAGHVVPKPDVEARQVDGVVEQMLDRVLEGAGQELRCEVDREQPRVGVDHLLAGHGTSTAAGMDHRLAAWGTRRTSESSVSTSRARAGFSCSFVMPL